MLAAGSDPTGIVASLVALVQGRLGIGICVILIALAAGRSAMVHNNHAIMTTLIAVGIVQTAAWWVGY
jgi:hypothetical protein